MSKLVPSKYQLDVFDFVENGTGSGIINAVAGSGKTTTIVGSLKFVPKDASVIYLAFNKSIVENLKSKIPSNITVKTFHSIGASAIYKVYKNKSVLDNNKIFNLVSTQRNKWAMLDKVSIETDYVLKIKKIVDISKLTLSYDTLSIKDVCYKHGIQYDDKDIQRVLDIIDAANNDISTFDFNDMVYWPAKFNHFQLEKYDMIYVDECQDLNKAQHKLIEKMSHPKTRLIAVGDRFQSIYGFAGADTDSFDNLTKIPNIKILPLSISYRCGSDIIKLAKTIVPHIESHENATCGIVDYNASINNITENDMVICRLTLPLVKLCLDFLKQNKKAYVKGSDIGDDLIKLITKSNTTNCVNLLAWLNIELEKIFNKLKYTLHLEDAQVIEHNTYIIFSEKIALIDTFIKQENILLNKDLIFKIQQVFMDLSNNSICLSTIHRVKGLESDRVFIIDKDKTMPYKYARLPWELVQEKNLMYVAYTRAKNYLGFVSDWTFFD